MMALVPCVSAGIFGRGCPPRAWGWPRGGARAVRCRGGRARAALKDAANPLVEVLVWWWRDRENVSAMSEPGVLRCAERPGDGRAVWETTIGMDAAIGIINYSSAVARREVL